MNNQASPPAGYVECAKKCGRWFSASGPTTRGTRGLCNLHWLGLNTGTTMERMDRTWGPDWTPPIAASAKPVERRKGQRYLVGDGSVATLASDLHERRWNVTWDNGYTGEPTDRTVELWIKNKEWTLLTDAPADPSGAGEAEAVLVNEAVGAMYPQRKVPPAQEAPKAAPMNPRCAWSHISACDGEKLLRHVRQADRAPPMRWCEKHYLESEARPTDATGTPYKGPERINRALARDELVEGDCWPEGSR